jgi:hypothetical protein
LATVSTTSFADNTPPAAALPDAVGAWTYGAETSSRWEYATNLAVGVTGRKFVVGEEGAVQTFFYF